MVATIDYDTNPELCPASFFATDKVGHKRQRSVVRFDVNVTHRLTYCKADVTGCWYSDEEYQAIKEEVLETVELMRQNTLIDDVNYCRRGLEWFEKGNDEKNAAIEKLKRPVRIVMDIQAMDQGACQDSATLVDSIAQHYTQESQYDKMTAYLTGVADERYAKSIAMIEVTTTGNLSAVPPTSHKNNKSATALRRGLPPRSPPRRVTPTSACAA